MPSAQRLSRDAKWWGVRGYWTSTVSADGARRWDGHEWAAMETPAVPDCLETKDPSALAANRAGRMTLGQGIRFAPRLGIVDALDAGWCAFDLVGLVLLLTLAVLPALVILPLLVLLWVAEWLLGVRSEEGRLTKVIDGRQKNVLVDETLVAAHTRDFNRMKDGAYHRLYFSRMTLSLVNYERLGGAALDAAQRSDAAHPPVRFAGRDTDISIWASELRAGALPRICVKSGQPATTELMFGFVTPGLSFKRAAGPLPMINAWRLTFMILRRLGFVAAASGVVGLFSIGAAGSFGAPLAVASFVAIALVLLAFVLYRMLRPRGDVHATETGELFVMLRDVNPRFVDAVRSGAPDEAALPVSL